MFKSTIMPIQKHSLMYLYQVLMSATIDAVRFSQYFNGCSIIQVPGFTYPVSKLSQIEYLKLSEIFICKL